MKQSVFLVTLATISLAACGQTGSQAPAPPAQITTPDAKLVADQDETDALLSKVKMKRNASRREYFSDGPIAPCDPELLNSLELAGARMITAEVKMEKDAPRYNDKALEFSRRVSASLESLVSIRRGLLDYCQADLQAQSVCFKEPGAIWVTINEPVAQTPLLHAYLKLDPKSDALISAFVGDNGVREPSGQSSRDLYRITNVEKYGEVARCLAQTKVSSDFGKEVTRIPNETLDALKSRCDLLNEAWRSKRMRSGFEPENEFCLLPKN